MAQNGSRPSGFSTELKKSLTAGMAAMPALALCAGSTPSSSSSALKTSAKRIRVPAASESRHSK